MENINNEEIQVWSPTGEKVSSPIPVRLCSTHTKENWMKHEGYTQLKDGSISCDFCPWGGLIPGYMRVIKGKVVDLRSATR